MKRLSLLLLAAAGAFAQTDLPGPVRSLPSESHAFVNGFGGWDAAQVFWAGFRAPVVGLTANEVWTLPSVDGSAGQVLGWASAHTLAWVSGGGVCPTCMLTTGGQTVTGSDQFNVAQVFAAPIQFWPTPTFGGFTWEIGSPNNGLNQLAFYDSSSVIQAFFDNSGTVRPVLGTGVEFKTPSLLIEASTTDSMAMLVNQHVGSTVDILRVQNAGTLAQYFWIDVSGGTHIANCVSGCGTTPADMMTTDTNQNVTGQKNFQVSQIFSNPMQFWQNPTAGGFTWEIGSPNNGLNQLAFYDSGSTIRAFLDNSGTLRPILGTGVEFSVPSLLVTPSTTDSMAMLINQPFGSTTDVLRVQNSGTMAQYFWIDSTGLTNAQTFVGNSGGTSFKTSTSTFTVSSSGLVFGVEQVATNPGSNIAFETGSGSFSVTGAGDMVVHSCIGCGAGGVVSVSAVSPIVSSGGANPSISCTVCVTNNANWTIAASYKWSLSGFSSLTINPATNEIQPQGGWNLGDSGNRFSTLFANAFNLVNGGNTTTSGASFGLATTLPVSASGYQINGGPAGLSAAAVINTTTGVCILNFTGGIITGKSGVC